MFSIPLTMSPRKQPPQQDPEEEGDAWVTGGWTKEKEGRDYGLATGLYGGSTRTHLCAAMAAAWFVVRVCPTMVAAAELAMSPPMVVVELSRA
jgi:hypothetical protein